MNSELKNGQIPETPNLQPFVMEFIEYGYGFHQLLRDSDRVKLQENAMPITLFDYEL